MTTMLALTISTLLAICAWLLLRAALILRELERRSNHPTHPKFTFTNQREE